MRGRIDEFRALDVEPFGIVPDGALTPTTFMATLDLPFPLLIDPERRVAESFGATKPEGSGIERTVLIVGRDGRVLYRHAGGLVMDDVLAALRDATDAAESPAA